VKAEKVAAGTTETNERNARTSQGDFTF
jgi:hypothetical protein